MQTHLKREHDMPSVDLNADMGESYGAWKMGDDAALAGKRMVEMVRAGAIITESGKHIPTRIDTICLHGDTAEAVQIAAAVRSELEAAGISLAQFKGHRA
jgi:lactam utilization protein B